MQADAFLFDHLVMPGDSVIVERPTYDRTLLGLRQRGADVRSVELEPDGIDVDGVARLLDGGVRPKLVHIIPTFQNPAGYTLGRAKRDALVALAGDRGFTLFEDDPYVSLRFAGVPLPTMLSLDGDDVVVYASSFSKTVCPGVRVGYLVGPSETIAAIVVDAVPEREPNHAVGLRPVRLDVHVVRRDKPKFRCGDGRPSTRLQPSIDSWWIHVPMSLCMIFRSACRSGRLRCGTTGRWGVRSYATPRGSWRHPQGLGPAGGESSRPPGVRRRSCPAAHRWAPSISTPRPPV